MTTRKDPDLADIFKPTQSAPIALFDSGLGGLTVVREIRKRLPAEDLIYFGDTARVPYGNKSVETVARFTREICAFLLHMEPKCVIAACNTVSATVVPDIPNEFPVAIYGVLEPTAHLAARSTRNHIVAVLGTEATIASCAFERAIRSQDSQIRVVQQSCPLFVPIVEEGRQTEDPILKQAIRDYLAPVKKLQPDVVVLACTHYPALRTALEEYLGPEVQLIDSGEAVAAELEHQLRVDNLLSSAQERGTVHCYVSDYPQRFAALAAQFLGEPMPHVIRANAESWQSAMRRSMGASA